MRFLDRLRRFMAGRYGVDELNFALMIATLILSFVRFFVRNGWVLFALMIIDVAIVTWLVYRMLSKKIFMRQKENRAFLKVWNPIKRSVSQWISRRKDTAHRYIRCKKCRERLRLPRGKGRIEVTCPKCRERFITKT